MAIKKKKKKKRKYKPDDIRKKIKVRFHKQIKNIINENLKRPDLLSYSVSYLNTLFQIYPKNSTINI